MLLELHGAALAATELGATSPWRGASSGSKPPPTGVQPGINLHGTLASAKTTYCPVQWRRVLHSPAASFKDKPNAFLIKWTQTKIFIIAYGIDLGLQLYKSDQALCVSIHGQLLATHSWHSHFQAASCSELPLFFPEASGLQISGICQSKRCFPSGCLSVRLKPQETFAVKHFETTEELFSVQ